MKRKTFYGKILLDVGISSLMEEDEDLRDVFCNDLMEGELTLFTTERIRLKTDIVDIEVIEDWEDINKIFE